MGTVVRQPLNLLLACMPVMERQELHHFLQVKGSSPMNVFSYVFKKNPKFQTFFLFIEAPLFSL